MGKIRMGFVMFPTVRRRMCQISLKGKSGDSLRDFEGKFWPGAFVIRKGLKNIIQIISAATSTEWLFTFFNFFTRGRHFGLRYRTSRKGMYICSVSTPEGVDVHRMCGYNVGKRALKDIFRIVAVSLDGGHSSYPITKLV